MRRSVFSRSLRLCRPEIRRGVRVVMAGLGALAVLACGSSGSGSSRSNPTYIEVAPEEFLGDIPCTGGTAALQWYVATLIDITDRGAKGQAEGFRLPSSPPTRCSQSVFFTGVVGPGRVLGVPQAGREYTAEIEAYTEVDVEPLHEGSNVLLHEGEVALPHWLGACGQQRSTLLGVAAQDAGAGPDGGFEGHFGGPVVPVFGRTVRLRGCSLQEREASATNTSVRVNLTQALGELECGEQPGQVARFEVEQGGNTVQANCGEDALFPALTPGTFLEFAVTAFEASAASDGGTAENGQVWRTQCYQEPVAGLTLTARCDPLLAEN